MKTITNTFFAVFGLIFHSFSQTPLAIPPVLSGNEINLNLQTGSVQFLPGAGTSTMGANGNLLGPTIILDRYQDVTMNVTNSLGEPTTIHWHGMHVAPENDGGPHTVIMPGETWSPSWNVLDWASTHWYHPHLHHMTNAHVQKGIAGMIIVRDAEEQALTLPRTYGVDDFPIVVQTKAFDINNQIIIESALDVNLMVNGTIDPFLDAPAQMVRLRLLNGSSERYYNFGFSNSLNFQMIGSDGGLLTAPLTMNRIMLAPGERAEIVVNLSAFEGQSVFLRSFGSELPNAIYGAAQPGMGGGQVIPNYTSNPLNGNDFNVLQINVQAPTANPVTSISAALTTHNPWPEASANATRDLLFQPVNQGPTAIQGPFTINGAEFDMDVINYEVPFENIEVWVLTNQTPISHPFHIHDVSFYILDINGNPPPAHLQGRKDVVHVPAGNGVVRFITKFDDYFSDEHPYMYHCHMLTHEDGGMMGQFLVMPPCLLEITQEPADVITPENTTVQFSVEIGGPDQTYQWQTNLGFGFVDLSNAGQYSGVNTATLTVSNVTFSNNNQLFRCVIGNGFCSEITREALLVIDNDASLTTNELESFTLYPNPTTETITIERISEMTIDYAITDMTGRVVATGKIDSLQSDINVSQLETGSYQFLIEGSKPSTFVKTK
jgi:FtsP/CotA-like multicopper oxidase with cupredoxin domain